MLSVEEVKSRTAIHDNIDNKLIFPHIKAVQDLYIRPLLGSVLFDKMLTDASENNLDGVYKAIMDDYLVDAICNYVLSELPEGLNYQFWNKGLSKKTADGTAEPSMAEMYAIVAKYKKRGEHYANACRLHIMANIKDFPEYTQGGGVDRVYPDRTTFSSPFYLDEVDMRWGKANHDPNYNSNDPYTTP